MTDNPDSSSSGISTLEGIIAAFERGSRVVVDWGGPPETIGDAVYRELWANRMNQEFERRGLPFRVGREASTVERIEETP